MDSGRRPSACATHASGTRSGMVDIRDTLRAHPRQCRPANQRMRPDLRGATTINADADDSGAIVHIVRPGLLSVAPIARAHPLQPFPQRLPAVKFARSRGRRSPLNAVLGNPHDDSAFRAGRVIPTEQPQNVGRQRPCATVRFAPLIDGLGDEPMQRILASSTAALGLVLDRHRRGSRFTRRQTQPRAHQFAGRAFRNRRQICPSGKVFGGKEGLRTSFWRTTDCAVSSPKAIPSSYLKT